jgi:hypothetical protein
MFSTHLVKKVDTNPQIKFNNEWVHLLDRGRVQGPRSANCANIGLASDNHMLFVWNPCGEAALHINQSQTILLVVHPQFYNEFFYPKCIFIHHILLPVLHQFARQILWPPVITRYSQRSKTRFTILGLGLEAIYELVAHIFGLCFCLREFTLFFRTLKSKFQRREKDREEKDGSS